MNPFSNKATSIYCFVTAFFLLLGSIVLPILFHIKHPDTDVAGELLIFLFTMSAIIGAFFSVGISLLVKENK